MTRRRPPIRLRERAFVPTELTLLLHAARMPLLHLLGATAGNGNRAKINLVEFEIVVVAQKPDRDAA